MSTDQGPGDRPYWEAYLGDERAAAGAPTDRRSLGWDDPSPPVVRERPLWVRRLTLVVLALAVLAGVTGSSAGQRACRAGIPAYFYPVAGDAHWSRVSEMSPRTLIVVNPANGPGTAIDPNYVAALKGAGRSRPVLYGYVDTAYGTRSADLVRQEAKLWRAWYAVDGIFLDQTSSGADDVDYYAGLADWLHAAGLEVAMNPGQPVLDRRYVRMADHVVTFEGPYQQYVEQRFPTSRRGAVSRKAWHLVYDVPDRRRMREVVALARSRGVGLVYVTDGSMPNPWDRLPAYWAQEQQLLDRC
jgi:hypothetical protein